MTKGRYRPTEAQYKGGAEEMYVTYDLEQRTRGNRHADYPKVKRVYIAGKVTNWKPGVFQNRVGRDVRGLRIEYQQRRAGYRRSEFAAHRGSREYKVGAASVKPTAQHFVQVVELPERARNVHFYQLGQELPERYRGALQRIR